MMLPTAAPSLSMATPNVLAFMDIGFGELVVVGFVALVLFGGRLPEVMRTLGRTYRGFRQSVEGLTQESRRVFDPRSSNPPYRPAPPPLPTDRAGSTSSSPATTAAPTPVAAPAPPAPPSSDPPASSFDDAPPV